MRKTFGARGAIFGLLAVACALPLGAQEYRGRVQGFVTDPSKAAVIGADVTLTNQGTGIAVTRQTTENGMYLFDLVQPGTYSIAVQAAGFTAFEQKGIIVQTRGDVTVNASLQVGAMTETIEVVANATT
ncbi:MAG: carboxypeptidase regulatory-like domain-containing protein, partial [Bryobacteraceae bacterium]|nr:carboxypeptidase regulatory-like domain-containing protein [Bryobacteraceae bacterium]